MKQSVGLVHATPLAIPPVREAFGRLWPEVQLVNILDEGLLVVLEADGSLGPRAVDRMARVIGLIRDTGVSVIQLSCSAYSPLVPTLRKLASVPVLAIDDVLVETSVQRGRRIGVISTQAITAQSIQNAADCAGRTIELTSVFFRDAFEALARGDGDAHDRLLRAEIEKLADQEVIVLAQASMTRVLPTLSAELRARVLTSPTLAVETSRAAISAQ